MKRIFAAVVVITLLAAIPACAQQFPPRRRQHFLAGKFQDPGHQSIRGHVRRLPGLE
jgi:hypothetical protein